MPVKASNGNGNSKSCAFRHAFFCGDFAGKIFATLVAIMVVYVIVWVGTMIRNNLQRYDYIGQADRQERTISIQAEGKVTAKPDIAMTTMGMLSSGKTVAEAQEANTKVMNTLITRLKALGIGEDDIQTANYNIGPQYNWTEKGGRELLGYEVSQSVAVKIRDLTKANAVLALAGEVGANSVGGLQFTIDDRDVYKEQARDKALEKVAAKASALGQSLGVRFVNVISYDEFDGGAGGPVPYAAKALDSVSGPTPPTVEAGSLDVVMNVAVTFEIR